MATVWLANTASLLLPVSALTNLLALHRFSALGLGYSGNISLALWPAMAAIRATVIVLAVFPGATSGGGFAPRLPRHPTTGRCSLWPHQCAWRSGLPSSVESPLLSRSEERRVGEEC